MTARVTSANTDITLIFMGCHLCSDYVQCIYASQLEAKICTLARLSARATRPESAMEAGQSCMHLHSNHVSSSISSSTQQTRGIVFSSHGCARRSCVPKASSGERSLKWRQRELRGGRISQAPLALRRALRQADGGPGLAYSSLRNGDQRAVCPPHPALP
jgi:hypothetical protein